MFSKTKIKCARHRYLSPPKGTSTWTVSSRPSRRTWCSSAEPRRGGTPRHLWEAAEGRISRGSPRWKLNGKFNVRENENWMSFKTKLYVRISKTKIKCVILGFSQNCCILGKSREKLVKFSEKSAKIQQILAKFAKCVKECSANNFSN